MQIYRLYRSFGNLLIISQRILFVYFLAIFIPVSKHPWRKFYDIEISDRREVSFARGSLHGRFTKSFFQGKFRWKYESWIQPYSMIQLKCSAESMPISLLFSCENWDTANTKWIWLALSNDVIAYENLLNQVIWMLSESRI